MNNRKITRPALVLGTTAMVLASGAAFAAPVGGWGDLVEAVSPSVVFIEVSGVARPGPETPVGAEEAQGLGTGFIISGDGEIVTNHHVIDGASSVEVKLADGRSYDAVVVGSDPLTDIALLKITTDADLSVARFGVSADMRAGDDVLAVGNPFGLGNTVTTGIVSATSRNIHAGPFDDFIQTDAAINRGNSGGPLFNDAGEVIGVNSMIFSPGGGSVGIGFAVPSDLVQTVVADLMDDGTITRGWLGVQIKPMSDEIADVLGLEGPKGAVVEKVVADSPAAKAGLIEGDIILSIDGVEISELRDLTRAVANTAPDATATMDVLHKGKKTTLDVKIGLLGGADA
jgi:serine protease Do